MRVSDVAALPFGVGSAIRGKKLFHPSGLVATGSLERLAALGDGLPVESGPVVARVSKAIGLPAGLPDIGGLAWRMSADRGREWDLLLATVFGGALGRVLLRPITTWSQAVFSTLMPLACDGRAWTLRATIVTPIWEPGLGLGVIGRLITRDGLDVDLEQARGVEPFRPLARMRLIEVQPTADLSFDPVRNHGPGVELLPRWLTAFRRSAYQRSRTGRHGTAPTAG